MSLTGTVLQYDVTIPATRSSLAGSFAVPPLARGIVLIARDCATPRLSSHNCAIARFLNDAGFATLLLDLLTPHEELAQQANPQAQPDVPLLATRLTCATDWLSDNFPHINLPIGYFASSHAGAAAMAATAQNHNRVKAVVSQGSLPTLPTDTISTLCAPTLLIVGGNDEQAIESNQAAIKRLGTPDKMIMLVAGASHHFQELGKIQVVACLAAAWFNRHLKQTHEFPADTAPSALPSSLATSH
jgi:putative phosphoribosyl transferase